VRSYDNKELNLEMLSKLNLVILSKLNLGTARVPHGSNKFNFKFSTVVPKFTSTGGIYFEVLNLAQHRPSLCFNLGTGTAVPCITTTFLCSKK
jgi:hypothetical protein